MPALYQSQDPDGGLDQNQRTTTAVLGSIQVTNKVTGTRTAGYSVVVADAESTDSSESIAWTQSGALGNGFLWLPNSPSTWSNTGTTTAANTARKTAGVGNACDGTNVNQFPQNSNTTARANRTCTAGTNQPGTKTGTAMLQASPATATGAFSVTQTMVGQGLQGVAFGVITAGAQLNVTVADRVLTNTGAPSTENFTGTLVGTAAGGAQVGSWTATTGATETSASTEAQHMPLVVGSTTNLTFSSNAADAAATSYRAGWRCTKTNSDSNTPTYWPSQTTSSADAPSATANDATERSFAQLGAGEFIECTVTYTPPYLTLVKSVINTGTNATNTASQWTLTAEQGNSSRITGVSGAPTITRRPVALGSYNLTEAGPTGNPAPWTYGYTWTDLVCSTNPANPALPADAVTKTVDAQNSMRITASTLTITEAAATYTVQPNVTCTYTNRANPPSATVTIGKQILNVQGTDPQPAAGWTVGATLSSPAAGTTITTPPTQTTESSGQAPNPWTVGYAVGTLAANVNIRESMLPGYEFVSSSCVITAAAGGATRTQSLSGPDAVMTGLAPGESAACTFVNRPLPGTVLWQKTDAAAQYLAGSEWKIVGPSPATTELAVTDCVAANDAGCTGADTDSRPGYFRVTGLAWGSYQLIETRPPAGFLLDATPRSFSLAATTLTHTFTSPFVNQQQAVPALPLTGGLSSDGFLIGGGALLLGAAGALLLLRRRRAET